MTRVAVAVAAVLVLLATGCGQRSRVNVVVGGTVEQVATGSTLAEATARLGLEPRAGNLLDVEGDVLRAGAFSGRLLVNGRRVPSSSSLHDGDRIDLVAGRSRVERREREVRRVRGGIWGNPQSRIERTAGVEIVVRGAVSKKLVSSRYRAVEGSTDQSTTRSPATSAARTTAGELLPAGGRKRLVVIPIRVRLSAPRAISASSRR